MRSLRGRPRQIIILSIASIVSAAALYVLLNPYTVKTFLSYATRPAWDTLIYPSIPIINLSSDLLFSHHDSEYICSVHNTTVRQKEAKVWDAIIFSTELDMLEIHLAELYDVVEMFIILESTVTYSGQPKELVFKDNKDRFKRFSKKINHVIFEGTDLNAFSGKPGSFEIEIQQRGYMTSVINDFYRSRTSHLSDILVLVSDVDEIPYTSTLNLVKTCQFPNILHLGLIPYIYSYEWISGDLDSWHIQLHNWDPEQSYYKHSSKSSEHYITAAGTHCSFCFPGIEDFKWKMKAYSHNDRLGDHPKALMRTERIQRAICNGENIFGMLPEAYTWWDLLSRWNGHLDRRITAIEAPKLVQAEPERFSYLLPGGCVRKH